VRPKTFMFIAGEASGDVLASELVSSLRTVLPALEADTSSDAQPLHTSLAPRFFGAGGPRMAEAGVELAFDMTTHSVVGVTDVLKNLGKIKRFFNDLKRLAIERQPDAIVCVDYGGFNLRFALAIKKHVESQQGTFRNWRPLLVQFISPQVWASRAGRAQKLEHACDLLLSIFPFEKSWYSHHAPKLRVEFVGHPIVDRYKNMPRRPRNGQISENPLIVLLPGSRPAEVQRHLPVIAEAYEQISKKLTVRNRIVLPNHELLHLAQGILGKSHGLVLQAGGLPNALQEADLAIASTGTVTMECAWFGVPTVALYKTSWSTFQIAKRVVHVPFLAMPNILAQERIYPEFLQEDATAQNLAGAALELLSDAKQRLQIETKLDNVIQSLGASGAPHRAAEAISHLLMQSGGYDIKASLT
jgi:lipid-A-disaccharide synthase